MKKMHSLRAITKEKRITSVRLVAKNHLINNQKNILVNHKSAVVVVVISKY